MIGSISGSSMKMRRVLKMVSKTGGGAAPSNGKLRFFGGVFGSDLMRTVFTYPISSTVTVMST